MTSKLKIFGIWLVIGLIFFMAVGLIFKPIMTVAMLAFLVTLEIVLLAPVLHLIMLWNYENGVARSIAVTAICITLAIAACLMPFVLILFGFSAT
jgi:hypothetical protein